MVTRYYNSAFLGKASEFLGITSAQDLYEKFISCLLEIEPNKLLQVSSDGPNVNLTFLDILNRFREDNEQPHLVNIGLYGLHTLHNAFKNGVKLAGSLYKIFDGSPSPQADYEKLTMAQFSDYPLQFCTHRWVENQNMAKRAQKTWEKIAEIVNIWQGLPKSGQAGQGKQGANSSYDHF